MINVNTSIDRYERHGIASIPIGDLFPKGYGTPHPVTIGISEYADVEQVRYAWINNKSPRSLMIASERARNVPSRRVSVTNQESIDLLVEKNFKNRIPTKSYIIAGSD